MQSSAPTWHAELMRLNQGHIGSNEPATKGDIEQLREDLHADMARMEERFENRFGRIENRFAQIERRFDRIEERITEESATRSREFNEFSRGLFEKIDQYLEHRNAELGAAKAERVLSLEDKVSEHDGRITALERQESSPRR